MSDIRKWFMKQHDKGNASAPAKPAKSATLPPEKPVEKPLQAQAVQENSGRRKTSKYFATAADADTSSKQKMKDEAKTKRAPARKTSEVFADEDDNDFKPSPAKKLHKDEDDAFVLPNEKKKTTPVRPAKKLKNAAGVGVAKHSVDDEDDNEEDELALEDVETPVKAGGRGKGGRGSGAAAGGRGRGGGRGGRGGFMNFGERKDPPHKGEKEVPEGAPDCLSGLTFVISGTLDSLEREEAEDLIKRHGGRVTGSVSKKTNYLLADEDIGGNKSKKAKELGTTILTEDGLFDMIRKSKPVKVSPQKDLKKQITGKADGSQVKSSPSKRDTKDDQSSSLIKRGAVGSAHKRKSGDGNSLTWTEKYRPKVPNDIVGNQSIIKQLHDWLARWHEQFLYIGHKGKGKKQNDSGFKKAVLISGSPGIGKSTSAKLVSQMLGFKTIEVNASDSRGKADSKILKGIGGSTSNCIKEFVNNEALSHTKDRSKHPKSVLIMDEVDGMSAGDRGGVADLIASIKISKIPIICICNDRYSQKLKSLINYCLPLNFRKPTKQQMAKRLMQIASAEGLQVNEIALEELADRVNGDIRMALNQLQYMSFSQSVLEYDDIKRRLLASAKDEDISPFTAVDKLFGFNGGKLRMDERIDLCMSDPDLVPLIIQENYINYRPTSIGKDENGVKRMNLLARAAESIADGDVVNVQIRRYRQWQLSQAGSFASCIVPAALMHGNRETFESGERNFNRFGGWLGKNSTTGKNLRLLEDVHVHVLASQESSLDRETLRLDYVPLILKQLTDPLRVLPKDAAVQKVVEFMDAYSLSQEDFDTIVELSKFQGHPNPMDGIQPAVKAALTKAYKQGSSTRHVRVADLITLPGQKKAPKKRIAAILEPDENGLLEENGGTSLDGEEEDSSDTNDAGDGIDPDNDKKPQFDLLNNKSKGIQVQLDLKNNDKPNAKKTPPASKPRGSASTEKRGGLGKRRR
ncbi:replication factor C subunit 1 protein [Dioscorea alata]|uniref:Replication factor C subunit 1 protein n=1 Tax=Dioscorea alata TaxID=55571 RepID=A0ACB7TY95_DIOAL|nr:replication factor C subunit 1 protein [Dioscorea alata]